jgi:alpha-N-arabinofuranosidase
MKQVDPSILVTCAGSQDGMKVSEKLLTVAGKYLDYISVHNYWLDRGEQLPRYDYLTAITKSGAPEAYIAQVCGSLDEAGQKGRLKVAFDEWNLRAWQHPGFPRDAVKDYEDPGIRKWVEQRRRENDLASQYTMADALFAASFLNACLRHSDRLTMANIAPLVNTRGPLFVHPNGIVRRTHFHTLAMYANLLRERAVGTQVIADKLAQANPSVAIVDAIATTDASGKHWAIALVNRHPSDAVVCTISLKGVPLEGPCQGTVLTGGSPDAYNDTEHPDRVAPKRHQITFKNGSANLPPHSLMIIQVKVQ